MGRKKIAKESSDLVVTLRLPLAAADEARRRAVEEDRPFSAILRRLILAGLAEPPLAAGAARGAGTWPLGGSGPISGREAPGGPLRESGAAARVLPPGPHGTGLARLFSAADVQRAAAQSICPDLDTDTGV